MESISPDYFFLILGFILIVIELTVLTGATGGWLLFIGIGALVTGLLSVLGLFSSWTVGILLFTVLSVVSTLILWKFFKSKPKEAADEINMIGETVKVKDEVTKEKTGTVSWSGATWQAEIDKSSKKSKFLKGDKAIIARTKNITVYIKEEDG